jgi:hypothetical protein
MTILINDYYLTEDQQDHILDFVNNAKNGIKNDKMIILLGSGKNGKTSLVEEIKRELDSYCENLKLSNLINNPNRKMIILDNDNLFRMRVAEQETLYYLICDRKENIIATANSLKSIPDCILDHSLVIHMKHAF